MEIIGYELHVKCSSSLFDIISALKAKGYEPEMDLAEDNKGAVLKLKHPSGSRHTFKVKLYKAMPTYKIFEIKAYSKPEMTFIEEVLNSLK